MTPIPGVNVPDTQESLDLAMEIGKLMTEVLNMACSLTPTTKGSELLILANKARALRELMTTAATEAMHD